MGMGFATNATVLPALIALGGDKVRVLSDELNHRSIVEGVRRAKAPKPKVKAFRHNDMQHLEQLLQESRDLGFDRVLIVVEGIYSMEGDFCRLREVVALKKKYG